MELLTGDPREFQEGGGVQSGAGPQIGPLPDMQTPPMPQVSEPAAAATDAYHALADTLAQAYANVKTRPVDDRVTAILKNPPQLTFGQQAEDLSRGIAASFASISTTGDRKYLPVGEALNALRAERIKEAEGIAKIQVAEEKAVAAEQQALQREVMGIMRSLMTEARAERRDAAAERRHQDSMAMQQQRADIQDRRTDVIEGREQRLAGSFAEMMAWRRDEQDRRIAKDTADIEFKRARVDTERQRADATLRRLELQERDLTRKIERDAAQGVRADESLALRRDLQDQIADQRRLRLDLDRERLEFGREVHGLRIERERRLSDPEKGAKAVNLLLPDGNTATGRERRDGVLEVLNADGSWTLAPAKTAKTSYAAAEPWDRALGRKMTEMDASTKNFIGMTRRTLQHLGDPATVIGPAGNVATFFSGVRAQAVALANAFDEEHVSARTGDKIPLMGILNPDRYDWGKLQAVAGATTKVKSDVVGLAYLLARSRDPSGRLSDADVQNAINSLGLDSNDKDIVAAVLMDRVTEVADNWANFAEAVTKQRPDTRPLLQGFDAVLGTPARGARKAPDGKWYVPDPDRPGKYLEVTP